MPAYKKPPRAPGLKEREFWGDETEGEEFTRLLAEKFGEGYGSIKLAVNVLGIQRRLLNMYMSGQRRIPDDVFATIRHMTPFDPDAIWDDGIDPLS